MKERGEIVGRLEEKRILEKLYKSSKAEFLAIYGRRRVGKTYLVRNYFRNKGFFFEVTGTFNTSTKDQLENFHYEYSALFDGVDPQNTPKNWREAFKRLQNSISKMGGAEKIVLFFDELPWLATPHSGFLASLDYLWNRHLCEMPNILLIVSGSAASWMINKVINNTGGLYGRLSAHLRLLPFTLAETEMYLKTQNIDLPRKQICEIYMVTGGIPKYLSYLEEGLSSAQNIHSLCFTPQSPLLTEFHKLYHSLFKNAESHLNIIRVLAMKRRGMSRSELIKKAKLTNSGYTSLIIRELEESGFITTLPEIGKKTRETNYYLSDEYTLFYLNWIEPEKGSFLRGVEKEYWIKKYTSAAWKSWAGFSFESLCLKHISQIKYALHIGGVSSSSGYWKSNNQGKKEIEIDLVIDRADQCINLCEIKFCNEEYELTKAYAAELSRKKNLFQERTKTKKGLFLTMITPYKIKENIYTKSVVDHNVSVDALFSIELR